MKGSVNVARRILSLCSGGGLDLGLRLALPGARTVCYLEREITAAGVLAKGIESGILDDAPTWTDLGIFDARAWHSLVHGVISGFPCQPYSSAGKRAGELDPRNLWPAIARLVSEISPAFCFFKNVPGIAPYYWRDGRPDLQTMGYETEEGIFSAEEVGKPKDLTGMPWRVASALQADGWWLRSDCVWSKPNPMPESVTDRPTKAHDTSFC